MTNPIRVFVGCAAGGEDAESCAVLDYTLRRYASRTVELTWMHLGAGPAFTGWNTAGWATPFSGLRWGIPHACGFEGRAIYMDSDMIVRADIAGLWDQAIPPGALGLVKGPLDLLHGAQAAGEAGGSAKKGAAKLRTCVMLMDCAAFAGWPFPLVKLKAHPNPHRWVTAWLKDNRHRLAAFEGKWNCLDLKGVATLDDPGLKIIHYSQMAHQPHLAYARRRLEAQGRRHWYDGETGPHWRPELQALFDAELTQAEAAGFHPALYDWGGPALASKRSFAGRPLKVSA